MSMAPHRSEKSESIFAWLKSTMRKFKMLERPSKRALRSRPSAFLAEARSDQLLESVDDFAGLRPAGGNADRIAGACRQHHQAHDRGAADLDAVLLDMDRGIESAGDLDQLR